VDGTVIPGGDEAVAGEDGDGLDGVAELGRADPDVGEPATVDEQAAVRATTSRAAASRRRGDRTIAGTVQGAPVSAG